jgi:hypothetical protein
MYNSESIPAFPSDFAEALAMLYLKTRDLTEKNPTEIHDMYWEANLEIRMAHKRQQDLMYKFSPED